MLACLAFPLPLTARCWPHARLALLGVDSSQTNSSLIDNVVSDGCSGVGVGDGDGGSAPFNFSSMKRCVEAAPARHPHYLLFTDFRLLEFLPLAKCVESTLALREQLELEEQADY